MSSARREIYQSDGADRTARQQHLSLARAAFSLAACRTSEAPHEHHISIALFTAEAEDEEEEEEE